MHESRVETSLMGHSDIADALVPDDAPGRSLARARLHERLFGHSEVREFGRYRLLEVLGRGGLGTVWRAHDRKLDREVALKLLHAAALRRPLRARQQLFAEAALMAKLNHANVVRVYDLDEHEGELFVAMELVAGSTLRHWQRQRRRSWRELLEVYLAAGAGLSAAHQAKLVHGDFKPDNVLIGDDGRVLVTDFAVTRHMIEARLELELASTNADTPPDSGRHSTDPEALHSGPEASQSGSGELGAQLLPLVIGTPAYMAPEQFVGQLADAAADQFAFCVSLWEALAGERPFRGRTWGQLHAAVGKGPQRDGRGPGPRMLWAALVRGLSVAPEDRWPSLEALLDRLRWARDRRRRWTIGAGAVGLCGLGFAAAVPTILAEADPQVIAVVQQCDPSEAPAEVSRHLDAAKREVIEAAFDKTGLSYAESAKSFVLTRLDGWGQTWTDARMQACRSTDASARTQLLCLDRNLASFAALVDVLAEADAGTVERVHELLGLLPEPDGCENFELPRSLDPSDPAALQRHVQLAGAVERVRFLWMVGRVEAGLSEIDGVIEAAEREGADVLQAMARHIRAGLWLDADKPGATDELFAVSLMARRAGAHEVEAAALMLLAHAEAMHGDPRPERWLDLAEVAVELEPSRLAWGELYATRGVVAVYREQPRASLEWYAKALEEFADADSYKRLSILINYGGSLIEVGERERGIAILRDAVEQATREWPAGMPDLGMIQNNLAIAESANGNFEAALEHGLRARDLLVPAFGDDHPILQSLHMNIAVFESELGRCDAARTKFDELMAELRATADPGDPLLPTVLLRRAQVCGETDANSRALADEGLERARVAFPEGGFGLARVAAARGWVLVRVGDYAEAEKVFAELEPAYVAELDKDSSDLAWLNTGYGLALAGQGKPEARERLKLGLEWLGPRWVRERAMAEAALAQLGGVESGPAPAEGHSMPTQ
jgi:serine/threonine protein kinase/tetratricopeptide (TPR) repeat protein